MNKIILVSSLESWEWNGIMYVNHVLLYLASGEGNGKSLQYSCLENPMDRGTCLWSMGSQRVGLDWSDWARSHACTWYLLSAGHDLATEQQQSLIIICEYCYHQTWALLTFTGCLKKTYSSEPRPSVGQCESIRNVKNRQIFGTSLAVQWSRLHASTAKGASSIPGHGAKIWHAPWCGQKIEKPKNKQQQQQQKIK